MQRNYKNKTANKDSMDCIDRQGIYQKGGTQTLCRQSTIEPLALIPIVYTTRLEDMVTLKLGSRKSTPADFIKNMLNESKPKFKGFIKTSKVKKVSPLTNQDILKCRINKIIDKSRVNLDNVKKLCHRPIITIDLTAFKDTTISKNTNDIINPHKGQLNVSLQNLNELCILGEDVKKIGFNQTRIENQVVSCISTKPIDCLNKENTVLDLEDDNLVCEHRILKVGVQSGYRSMLFYERSDIKQIVMFWEYNHHTYSLHRLINYNNPNTAALFQYSKSFPFKTKKTFCCWYKENSHLKKYFPQICLGVEMFLKSSHKCDRKSCTCCCNVSKKLILKPESTGPILHSVLIDNSETLLRLLETKMKLNLKSNDLVKNIPQNTIMYKALNFQVKRTNTFSNVISQSKHGIGSLKIVRIDHLKAHTTEYYKIGIKGDVLARYKFVLSENNVIENNALQSDLSDKTDISRAVCCWFNCEIFLSDLKKKIALSPAAVRFMKKRHLCTSMCKCCCRPKRACLKVPKLFLQTRQDIFKEMYDDTDCLRKINYNEHVSSTIENLHSTDMYYSMSEIGEAFANSHKSEFAEVNNFIHTMLEKFKHVHFKRNENGRVSACLDRPASDLSNDELHVMVNIIYFAQCHLNKVETKTDATSNVTFNLNEVETMSSNLMLHETSNATFNVNKLNLNEIGTMLNATPVNEKGLNTIHEREIDSPNGTSPTLPSISKEANESSGSANNGTVIGNVSISDENTNVNEFEECVNEFEEVSNVISSMREVNQSVISSFVTAQRMQSMNLQLSYLNSIKLNSSNVDPVITEVFSLADEITHGKAGANIAADAKNTTKAKKRKGDTNIKSSSKKMTQDMNIACSDIIDLTEDRDVQISNDNYSFDVPSTSKCKL